MSVEKKHLVTGALLAFVAVTGVTLAVKRASIPSSRDGSPSHRLVTSACAATPKLHRP